MEMKRIMIIGAAGSGKSTAARRIGERLGLPVYHMDRDVYWLPDWQERETDDRIRHVERITRLDNWVFEGGFSRTYDLRGARADLLIYLDLPLALRLYRVVFRCLRFRGQNRPDMAEGCRERLDMLPGFLWFAASTASSSRRKSTVFFNNFPRQKHKFTNVKDLHNFIERLL